MEQHKFKSRKYSVMAITLTALLEMCFIYLFVMGQIDKIQFFFLMILSTGIILGVKCATWEQHDKLS